MFCQIRHVEDNGEVHGYAQFYFLDSVEANAERQHRNVDLDPIIFRRLDDYIRQFNVYADRFRTARELMDENIANGRNMEMQLIFNRDYQLMPYIHTGWQNAPADDAKEVAAVFVLNDKGVPEYHRNLRVYMPPNILNPFLERRATRLRLQAATPIILPSTFTGSNRSMYQFCRDTLAFFSRFGRPNLFFTMTRNVH